MQNNDQQKSTCYLASSRLVLLAIVLTTSFWVSGSQSNILLSIAGGLFGVTLLILFPILIYNKTHRKYALEHSSQKS